MSSPSSGGSFDWNSIAPGHEHYQLALEQYHTGATLPEIEQALRRQGLAAEQVPEVLGALAVNEASRRLSAGKTSATIIEGLVQRGFSPEDAEAALRSASSRRKHILSLAGGSGKQAFLVGAGGLLLMAGLILWAVGGVPALLIQWLVGTGVVLSAFGGIYVYVYMS